MPKQFLKEEVAPRMMRLVESTSSKKAGCLGTMYGPCADYVHPTRNSNYYSRKLWENVFDDELVKEALEDRVLIGELDHPETRLETKASNACIVMTGYDFDDQVGVVNGKFDILDTPQGHILKSLLDYGCKIGVSSRGEGDGVEGVVPGSGESAQIIDEDSYYFVGFDAVAMPAVKKAKPALQESLDRRNLKESIVDQIAKASTQGELDIISKVLESAKVPGLDSIKESISNRSQELKSGTTGSSGNTLLEDLEKATKSNTQLSGEVRSLKEKLATSESLIKKIRARLNIALQAGRQVGSKYSAIAESCSKAQVSWAISSKKSEELSSQLRQSRDTIRGLQESVRVTDSKNSENESRISSLEESLRKSQETYRSLKRDHDKTLSVLESYKKQLASLKTQLSEVKSSSSSAVATARKESKNYLRSYVDAKSQNLGVNPKSIMESLKGTESIDEVDTLIESLRDRADRYSKMPITRDRQLESVDKAQLERKSREGEEYQSSVDFLNQAFK